jgi:hypothetical protein
MSLAAFERHPYHVLTDCFIFCLIIFLASIPLPRVDGMLRAKLLIVSR